MADIVHSMRTPKGNPDSHYDLGRHYQERGRYHEALAEFKKVIAIDPSYHKAYSGIGVTYDMLGDYTQAMEAYNKALEADPSQDFVYNNLGYSLLLQGKYRAAVKAFRKALLLDEGNNRYRSNLGLAFFEAGDFDQAMEEFELVAGEAWAHYRIAQLYFKKGIYWQSAAHFYKAGDLDPTLTEADKGARMAEKLKSILGPPEMEIEVEEIPPISANTERFPTAIGPEIVPTLIGNALTVEEAEGNSAPAVEPLPSEEIEELVVSTEKNIPAETDPHISPLLVGKGEIPADALDTGPEMVSFSSHPIVELEKKMKAPTVLQQAEVEEAPKLIATVSPPVTGSSREPAVDVTYSAPSSPIVEPVEVSNSDTPSPAVEEKAIRKVAAVSVHSIPEPEIPIESEGQENIPEPSIPIIDPVDVPHTDPSDSMAVEKIEEVVSVFYNPSAAAAAENKKMDNLPTPDPESVNGKDMVVYRFFVEKGDTGEVTTIHYVKQAHYLRELGIDVANGSGVKGLGQKVGNFLKNKGYELVEEAMEGRAEQSRTSILYCTGYLHPAFRVAELIPGYQEMEEAKNLGKGGTKVRIALGRDMVKHKKSF
jgi:hypothetical protein